MERPIGEITVLLRAVRQGDKKAESALFERIYSDLHRLAERYYRRERRNHTLTPTGLINEAYVHLLDQWDKDWQNRAHFLGVAALVMRRVLVDYARVHEAGKRGGGNQPVQLDEEFIISPGKSREVLAVDAALESLRQLDARQARIVELRFFGGLSEQETAKVLDVGLRTVQREWRMAKAWLYSELYVGRAAD